MGIFLNLAKNIFNEKTGVKPLDKLVHLDKQLVTGAVKGLGSTVSTVGELGDIAMSKTIGAGLGAITKNKNYSKPVGIGGTEKELENVGVKDAFTPTTTGQKVGFGAEQIGEFFVPGGAVTKGAKAVELAADAGKAAKYAKAIGTGAKIAGEGLAAAGTTLAQTGDPKEALISGALGSAGAGLAPGLEKGAQAFKNYMGEKVAPRVLNSLIKPISKEFEFGRNAGAGVVKEGIKANTREGLLTKITSKKDEIGKLIGDKLAGIQEKIDLTPAVSKIDDAVKKANKAGDSALASRLKEIKTAMTSEFDEATGEVIGQKNLLLTPADARKLKTEIGEATRWTGQAFDNDVNQARVAVYRGINDLIDNAVPGVKSLNARFADMLSAERALKRTIDIAERQNIVGLVPALIGGNAASIAAGGIGTAQGIAQGQSPGKAVMTGIGAAMATKALGSTAAKTRLFAPLAKNLGISTEKIASVVAKNNIPISGTLAKFIDALTEETEPKDSNEAAETVEEGSVQEESITTLQSQYPSRYSEFIDAAIKKGYSPEEVSDLLNAKITKESTQ